MQQNQASRGWQIADDGWPVLALGGLLTIIVTMIYVPLGTFGLGLLVWLSHILRIPNRMPPRERGLILAPADGRVIDVAPSTYPGIDGDAAPQMPAALRITIQTALTDAQLHMAPVDGRVVENFSIPGLYHPFDDMELVRADNERREITLRSGEDDSGNDAGGFDVMMVQLGGQTARQLVCRLLPGRSVSRASPIGMARIGGVVDLFVPATCTAKILVGQRVLAGETVVATISRTASKSPHPNKTAGAERN